MPSYFGSKADSKVKVKDSYRVRSIHSKQGIRYRLASLFDEASGWIAVAIIGTLTACVAFLVDVAEATVSDWKLGYCTRNPFLNREACCEGKTPLLGWTHSSSEQPGVDCQGFHQWSESYAPSFAIYVAFALAFGVISSSATMFTKRSLPVASPGTGDKNQYNGPPQPVASGKTMYMAAGSGIPEIKTILSGFVIPHFLDFKVRDVGRFEKNTAKLLLSYRHTSQRCIPGLNSQLIRRRSSSSKPSVPPSP